ncbi:MAG: hypothetical protein H6540_02990 [Bacteroidales bacterium]|nr:hypothetical protein [Bacteroidales bacterium]
MKFFIPVLLIILFLGISDYVSYAQDSTQNASTNQSAVTATNQTASETSSAAKENKTDNSTVSVSKPFPDDLDVLGQFDYAIDKSSNFREYKVIRQAWVTRLKSNTLDTLSRLKSQINTSGKIIAEKTSSIDSLQSELKITNAKLEAKNSFSFFGIMVSKAGYDTIMWSLIIGLLVALGLMIGVFRRSYAVTSQTRKDLNEVKEEFENFRKKALKSKEEAVRQLYDELSKYKNRK